MLYHIILCVAIYKGSLICANTQRDQTFFFYIEKENTYTPHTHTHTHTHTPHTHTPHTHTTHTLSVCDQAEQKGQHPTSLQSHQLCFHGYPHNGILSDMSSLYP